MPSCPELAAQKVVCEGELVVLETTEDVAIGLKEVTLEAFNLAFENYSAATSAAGAATAARVSKEEEIAMIEGQMVTQMCP